ncbi:YwmB family TATA-box binding protein [Heyndrickxia acidicola]|uniref:YwmB family TATA-box binding protein n=1 Tax=Heyndrickxia acidicola TaxID=209389 RepID=A0ABU6ME30_9BACI|nr:YwmB family TATA-box binding protein [Heyndrickxia acidicola]MED1202930.1 YwmB family TATA-box binding protein [Heyndrickxia acidicola]
MKKNAFFITVILFISVALLIVSGKNMASADSVLDMNKIVKVSKEFHGNITGWSLYARESFDCSSQSDWLNKVASLKSEFPNMNWQIASDARSKSATGQLIHKNSVETIKLVSTLTNQQPMSYLLYEVSGDRWNDQTAEEVNRKFNNKLAVLFNEKPLIFSCIKGEFNDKMDNVLLPKANNILKSLKAVKKEDLEEEDFVSISAYSPLFSEKLPTKNSSMNVQVGLRKTGLGAKTTFVIGTPIITIEY